MTELVVGDVYEIRSRNLLVGVYNERAYSAEFCRDHGYDEGYVSRAFIGIRTKFGERYLATEVLNNPPGWGTATPIRRLGRVTLPSLNEGHYEGGPKGGRFWCPNVALFTTLEWFETVASPPPWAEL